MCEYRITAQPRKIRTCGPKKPEIGNKENLYSSVMETRDFCMFLTISCYSKESQEIQTITSCFYSQQTTTKHSSKTREVSQTEFNTKLLKQTEKMFLFLIIGIIVDPQSSFSVSSRKATGKMC